MLDKNYWTQRYRANSTGWDIGYPSPPLLEFAKIFDKSLKILIPGAGNGHEALALAKLGYHNITVCDLSPIPLSNILEKDATKTITTIEGDFFNLTSSFDLILEQTFFCALDPNLRPAYIDQMSQLLNSNGILAGVLFRIEFEKEGPPFGGNIENYQALFSLKFTIVKMEICYNSIPSRAGNELFFIVKKA